MGKKNMVVPGKTEKSVAATQSTINSLFMRKKASQNDSSSGSKVVLEVVRDVVAEEAGEDEDDLEKDADLYLDSWKAKCGQSSSLRVGGPLREDIDLDRHGIKFVRAFRRYSEHAKVRNRMVPPSFLEYLVLVMRNDVVHQHSHVARAAYDCLIDYLDLNPYCTVQENGMQVLVSKDSAWLPFFSSRESFGASYLMMEDMSVAGVQYCRDQSDSFKPKSTVRPKKWGHVDEMLLHCIEKASQSDKLDYNGDLLFLDYLVTVAAQDAAVRIQVFRNILEKQSKKKSERELKGLLENSALWRMIVGSRWNPKVVQNIIRGLVMLIADCNEENGLDMEIAEEEPDDDAPAGACTFSKSEIAECASRLLNSALQIFGAMESIGGFLATSSFRSASTNYRICLDEYLVQSFWLEKGFCKNPESANALLCSLEPRDSIRFIGFVTSQKFTAAYDEKYVQRMGFDWLKKTEYMYIARDTINLGSKDVNSFFEIPVEAILDSLLLDMGRSVKMYRSADNIGLIIGYLALSLVKLHNEGQSLPIKSESIKEIKEKFGECIQSLKHQDKALPTSQKLGSRGYVYLSQADCLLQIL